MVSEAQATTEEVVAFLTGECRRGAAGEIKFAIGVLELALSQVERGVFTESNLSTAAAAVMTARLKIAEASGLQKLVAK